MTQRIGLPIFPEWLHGGELNCYLSDTLPDVPVTSSFCFVLAEGAVALCRIKGRGWDLPGGHVEVGETAVQAALRETEEEAGIKLPSAKLLGYMLIDAPGQFASSNGRYPDTAIQAVYAAALDRQVDLAPSLESLEAEWVNVAHVTSLTGILPWSIYLSSFTKIKHL